MGRWGRAVVYAFCGLLVVAIAYSRVYLGAHWLSDVVAGLLFGAVMMAAFGVVIEAIPPRRIKPLGLLAAALHQAAVASDHPGPVIDEVLAKTRGQMGLGHGHAHSGGAHSRPALRAAASNPL